MQRSALRRLRRGSCSSLLLIRLKIVGAFEARVGVPQHPEGGAWGSRADTYPRAQPVGMCPRQLGADLEQAAFQSL